LKHVAWYSYQPSSITYFLALGYDHRHLIYILIYGYDALPPRYVSPGFCLLQWHTKGQKPGPLVRTLSMKVSFWTIDF
jgi:hypothetical protein